MTTSNDDLAPTLGQPGPGGAPVLGGSHAIDELVQEFRDAIIAFYEARASHDGGKAQSAKLERRVVALQAKLRDAGRPGTIALAPHLKDVQRGMARYAAYHFEQLSTDLARMAYQALWVPGTLQGPSGGAGVMRLDPDGLYARMKVREADILRRWETYDQVQLATIAATLPEPVPTTLTKAKKLADLDTHMLVKAWREAIVRCIQAEHDYEVSLALRRQRLADTGTMADELRQRGPKAWDAATVLLTDENQGVRARAAVRLFEDVAPEKAVMTYMEMLTGDYGTNMGLNWALKRTDPDGTIRRTLAQSGWSPPQHAP